MNVIPVIPADAAKVQAAGSPPRVVACPERGAARPEAALGLGQIACPLQTAMCQVAEAAVTQHVLYAESVYRPREGLLHEMQSWLRLQELVRTGICPATRADSLAVEPGDLEIALAGVPVEMRAKVATAIRICGGRSRGEGCPLEAPPAGSLVE